MGAASPPTRWRVPGRWACWACANARWWWVARSASPARPGRGPPSPPAFRSRGVSMRRILLVDDNQAVRRSLRQVLSQALGEIVVGEAGGAAEALALIDAQAWDAVLLDLSLPDRS